MSNEANVEARCLMQQADTIMRKATKETDWSAPLWIALYGNDVTEAMLKYRRAARLLAGVDSLPDVDTSHWLGRVSDDDSMQTTQADGGEAA